VAVLDFNSVAVAVGVSVTVGVEVGTDVKVIVGVGVLVQTGGNVGTMTACVVGVDVIDRWDIAGPITPIYRITPIIPKIIMIKMVEMIQNLLPDRADFLPGKAGASDALAGTGRTFTGWDRSTRSLEAGGTDKIGGIGLFSAGDSTFAGGGEGGVLFP
jgi:hypothetical protein